MVLWEGVFSWARYPCTKSFIFSGCMRPYRCDSLEREGKPRFSAGGDASAEGEYKLGEGWF